MIIEISIAIIALAFLALVVYLILLIKSLRLTLSQVNVILTDARHHLDEIGKEAKKTTENVDSLTADINDKMKSFDSLFQAIENVGDYFEQKSQALKLEARISALRNESLESSLDSEDEEPRNAMINKVANVLELVGQSFRLWQDVHKRR